VRSPERNCSNVGKAITRTIHFHLAQMQTDANESSLPDNN
jgi:hypothetical protein